MSSHDSIRATIEALYRAESRRILATLIRLLGDFDLAEESLYDAFRVALEQWPRTGIPEKSRAWLVSTGRFKAIDTLRRRARFDAAQEVLVRQLEGRSGAPDVGEEDIADDRLRLIFICCHPAIKPEARIALTLREVCGLTTEEIARAFLVPSPTLAQRIVRAKAKIRAAKLPYEVPPPEALPERLGTVLQVVYLLFNEGYYATSGESVTRADLSGEAIRLGRLLAQLLPEPEVLGLLALMLLQESRRAARASESDDIVLLEDQDRTRWNQDYIAEGIALVNRVLLARPGAHDPYTYQAFIAAVHAQAPTPEATDWPRIVAIYDDLLRIQPTPVVALNRAVAVAMRDGPESGLDLIDDLLAQGYLADYALAHSAQADLLRRLGRNAAARKAYEQALALTQQGPERRFLEGRLAELRGTE